MFDVVTEYVKHVVIEYVMDVVMVTVLVTVMSFGKYVITPVTDYTKGIRNWVLNIRDKIRKRDT